MKLYKRGAAIGERNTEIGKMGIDKDTW